MTKTTEPVLEAMLHYWGGRCPDFDDTCPQCQAWVAYDALATLSAEVERLEERLGEAYQIAGHIALEYDGNGKIERLLDLLAGINPREKP